MRSREEIIAEFVDSYAEVDVTDYHRLVIELLIDIRDLLSPKEVRLSVHPTKPHRFISMDSE